MNLVNLIQSQFHHHFRAHARFILGVSGGKDSMLLAQLMLEAGITFHIAHVNYQLRGEDSDNDQALVEKWGEQNGIIVHCIKVQYSANEKNIQSWAREKRRDYFEILMQQEKASAIVLAHHLSDLWETHWLKLLRFQVEGNAGMVPFSPPYFRPLLYISKTMIDQEVHNRNLVYREDVSNQSDKYNRNFLRHQILPTIQERFGIEDNAIIQFNQRKADKESWNHYLMMNLLDQVITTDNHSATFDCSKIPHHLPLSTPLFHWLTPLGFSAEQIATISEWDRIENGKKMESSSHVLWKENHTFKVTAIDSASLETHVINGPLFLDLFDWQGKVTQLPNPALYGDKKYLQIDLDKITFPCTLRPWRHGEKFQPFGMTGHVLVSDYLNQKKIPAALKSKVVVLESNNHLAAILGMEVANWCRIQPETQNVWLIHPFPAQS